SSMLVCELAGIQPGDTVIDVCAAPGGKALHAADLLQGTGLVDARDITEAKTELIREHVVRCGFSNIQVRIQDAKELTKESIACADVVLADLPCSGLGIIGRKGYIKYHVTAEKLSSLIALQHEILKTVGQYVKPGGILMYSTCTIHRAENEETAAWIRQHLPFEPVSLKESLPKGIQSLTASEGFVQLLPGIHETDGFFIAKFRKDG
ncbi:MAG TPA: methyltransferase domain-containing protein, partial [Lachnospiraceae bacterium]|nr:methyltransferase domain-containing protein [Lachnospiraceae bacterium]